MIPQDPREKLARLMAEKAAAEKGLFCDRFDALVAQTPGACVVADITYQDLHSQIIAALRRLDSLQLPEGSLIGLAFDHWHRDPQFWPLILALFYTSHTLVLPEFVGTTPAASFCRFSDLGTRLIIGPEQNDALASDVTSYMSWSAFESLKSQGLPRRPFGEAAALMLDFQGHQVMMTHAMLATRLASLQALFPLPREHRVAMPTGPQAENLLHGLIWPLLHGSQFCEDDCDLTYRFHSNPEPAKNPARLELSLDPTCGDSVHLLLAPAVLAPVLGQRAKKTVTRPDRVTVVPNRKIMILDQTLTPLPAGQDGVLAVSGAVAAGFWRDPVATACHFVPDPFASEAGTRLLLLPGRAKLAGQTVSLSLAPSESHAALCYPYSGIRELVMRPIMVNGSQAHHHIAYLSSDVDVTEASLPASLRDDPRYHLVVLETLPINDSGEVDVEALEAVPVLHRSVLQQEADLAHALKKPVQLTYGALS